MIKFGMSLPQIFNQLVKGYQKVKGTEPKGLDLIKIKQEAMLRFKEMNKVVDMKGKSIDTSKGIMGGKQADKLKKYEDDLPMAQGGRAGFKEGRIARFLKSIKPFGSENKFSNQLEGILYGELGLTEGLNLLSQSGLFAEGGRIGYADGTPSFEEYMRERKGMEQKMNLEQMYKEYIEDMRRKGVAEQKQMVADGGRIGYKDGPDKPGRRSFMKAAVGLASLLPFGIGKGVKMAAPVVAKATELSGPVLAKLVETVMSAGKFISLKGKRVKEMVTKKKLGKVEVEEDIADGSYIIKKDGKEIYYKPGRMDETGGIEDDIIEVIEDRVKKAGGGIGYMLGE